MAKSKMKIKDDITMYEQIAAIKDIVEACFHGDEYRPYYFELEERACIAKYFIDGIELKENESIYDLVENDEDLKKLILKFYKDVSDTQKATVENKLNMKYIMILSYVRDNAVEIIDFKKSRIIHNADSIDTLTATVIDFISAIYGVIENFGKLDLGNLTPEKISNTNEFIQKVLKDGGDINSKIVEFTSKLTNKIPETDFYEEQRKEIVRLKNILKEHHIGFLEGDENETESNKE